MVMFDTRGKTFPEQNSKIGEGLDIMKVFRTGKVIQISLINHTKMNAGRKPASLAASQGQTEEN